jgi:hypothetical protein
MADLAPAIISEIALHNDEAIQCRHPRPGSAVAGCQTFLIQPIVVYLRNSPGTGLVDDDNRLAAELLVPLSGLQARNVQTSDATWLQRLDGMLDGVCTGVWTAVSCRTELQRWQGVRTVVVAPHAKPAPPPPLGWTLSEMSLKAMDAALEDEKASCPHSHASGTRPIAGLCELLKVASAAP